MAATLKAVSGAIAAEPPTKHPADLVLLSGTIVTVDSRQPRVQALAARGEKIVALGANADVRPLIGPQTHVIDLAGRLAIPGFIEGHGHLTGLGDARLSLDLGQARSWDEVVALVARQAQKTPPGEWIIGDGWHQGRWDAAPPSAIEGYPLHTALSRETANHPVLLKHATGHMCFANLRAMQLAGIDRDTPDAAGGKILRDGRGDATGVFREQAQSAIYSAWRKSQARLSPLDREAQTLRGIELAAAECLANGVTSFQDAGSPFSTIDLFRRLAEAKKLKLRLWVMVRGENLDSLSESLPKYRMIGVGDNRLTVRSIKCMVDGALGSHGAWLFQPYDDLPGSSGLVVESLESIRATGLLAVKHDYQLCTHAIGDRANHEILDLYEMIFRSHPGQKNRRWRIEHAQHVLPADFVRFAELGVIASMQGNHATSDGPFVVARLGEQRARDESYAWRSLLDHQALVINGTDVPVENVNPLLSFHASVTRRMRDGKAFFPAQCMTRDEALRSYTRDAAFAAFEEDLKGTLSLGKLADIVVLSKNILTVPEEEIPTTKVDFTILGGAVAYKRPGE